MKPREHNWINMFIHFSQLFEALDLAIKLSFNVSKVA